MLVSVAVASAATALAIREWVEWRERVKLKRRDCYHDFFETNFAGYITRHCRRCGFQESVRKDDL